MTIRNKNIHVEVKIDAFNKSGHGIGSFQRHDNITCSVEVPFTIPGDIAKVQLLPKRSGTYQSRLIEITSPSPDRIPAKCSHFGTCGGCRFQQISNEKQLQLKINYIQQCFPNTPFKILPPINQWNFRNKMEYTFSNDAAKNQYLGLILAGSRGKVLNLTECHLTNPWFIETLKAARNWWKQSDLNAYHPSSNTGSLRTLTLREGIKTGERMAILTVSGNPEFALKRHHLAEFTQAIKESTENVSIFLRIHQIIKGKPTQFFDMLLHGPDHITEKLNDMTFTISPSAFFQPNTIMAEQLYSHAINMAGNLANKVVYDLYCGTGTIGICIAKIAKEVVGIELSADSAYDARNNAALNKLDNITIYTGTVEDKLQEIHEKNLHPPPHLVIVDPPRVGLDPRAIQHLKDLKPPKILYISCNPTTQAKNIAELLSFGYSIIDMHAIDQFPHTPHIENIALLSI